jgi:hypothetical protein
VLYFLLEKCPIYNYGREKLDVKKLTTWKQLFSTTEELKGAEENIQMCKVMYSIKDKFPIKFKIYLIVTKTYSEYLTIRPS